MDSPSNEVSYKISKASIAPEISMSGWTYGQTPSTPVVSKNPGNGKVTYTYYQGGSKLAGKPTDAGSYTVKVSVPAAGNYKAAETSADFTIDPADPSIKLEIAEKTVYNGNAPVPTVSGASDDAKVDLTYYRVEGETKKLLDQAPSDVGSYLVAASVSKTTNYNAASAEASYVAVSEPASYTIKRKPLYVNADSLTKVYGTEDPELTYKNAELVGEDTLSGSLTREAGENAGDYAIEIGTLTAGDNYSIEFIPGTLTITPAEFEFSANGFDNVYDGKTHGISVSTPLQNNGIGAKVYFSSEKLDEAGFIEADQTESPTFTEAGEYTVWYCITTPNYKTVIGSETVRIAQREITITADNHSSDYGTALKELTYKLTAGAIVEGDDLGIQLTCDADANIAGVSEIKVSYTENQNYKVIVNNGTYTVNEEPDSKTSEESSESTEVSEESAESSTESTGSTASGESTAASSTAASGETTAKPSTTASGETTAKPSTTASGETTVKPATTASGETTAKPSTTASGATLTTTVTTQITETPRTTPTTSAAVATNVTESGMTGATTSAAGSTAAPAASETSQTTGSGAMTSTTAVTTTETTTSRPETRPSIELVVNTDEPGKAQAVFVPSEDINERGELFLKTADGMSVTFDPSAAQNIADAADGKAVSIQIENLDPEKLDLPAEQLAEMKQEAAEGAVILDLTIVDSDGNTVKLTDGGNVTIKMPYLSADGKEVMVYFRLDGGRFYAIPTTYDPEIQTIQFDLNMQDPEEGSAETTPAETTTTEAAGTNSTETSETTTTEATGTTPSVPTETKTVGDVNGDGKVDAAEILLYAAAQGAGETYDNPAFEAKNADTDGNGTIDAIDAIDAVNVLLYAAIEGAEGKADWADVLGTKSEPTA